MTNTNIVNHFGERTNLKIPSEIWSSLTNVFVCFIGEQREQIELAIPVDKKHPIIWDIASPPRTKCNKL